jgi:DNA-binding winged helix-turn-helix (wHTH) protein
MTSSDASSSAQTPISKKTLTQKLWDGYVKTTDTLTTLFPVW